MQFCIVELCSLILEYILKCGMLYIILMHIYHFLIFFANYYLLFILYLFQTREMMLDKKQIWAVFLFEFKMGCKAAETVRNISNAFAPNW